MKWFLWKVLFKIEKTEQAYADFVQKMKTDRWVFSFMNVAVDADSYVIFCITFFLAETFKII